MNIHVQGLLNQDVESHQPDLAVNHTDNHGKFECINGQIYAMGNTSFNHDLVKSELGFRISRHFDDHAINCRAIIEGKLHIGENYFIPDVMVVCKKSEEAAFSDPIIIIEILSDGTRIRDFGSKFKEYQKLETLEEYVVLEQDLMEAHFFAKRDNWKGSVCVVGDVMHFASIDFSITIDEIYKDVVLRKADKQ